MAREDPEETVGNVNRARIRYVGSEFVSGKPRAADRPTTALTAEAARRKGRAQWKRTGGGPRDRLRLARTTGHREGGRGRNPLGKPARRLQHTQERTRPG